MSHPVTAGISIIISTIANPTILEFPYMYSLDVWSTAAPNAIFLHIHIIYNKNNTDNAHRMAAPIYVPCCSLEPSGCFYARVNT